MNEVLYINNHLIYILQMDSLLKKRIIYSTQWLKKSFAKLVNRILYFIQLYHKSKHLSPVSLPPNLHPPSSPNSPASVVFTLAASSGFVSVLSIEHLKWSFQVLITYPVQFLRSPLHSESSLSLQRLMKPNVTWPPAACQPYSPPHHHRALGHCAIWFSLLLEHAMLVPVLSFCT